MSKQAEASGAGQGTAVSTDGLDSALLDVLPLSSNDQGTGERTLAFELDSASTAALTASPMPQLWLAAALVVVESRLSGADEVTASMIGTNRGSQLRTSGAGERTLSAVLTELAALPGGDEAFAPGVWAVAENDTACGAQAGACASVWSLRLDAQPSLQVRFRAPLTVAAVELMARCALRVLQSAALDPTLSVDAIDLLEPDDRRRQQQWSAMPPSKTTARTVVERFAEVRDATPEAVAVVDSKASLSYAGLDLRAGSLASRLHAVGVRPGHVVGVALPRSLDAIVALLGVLKCGAAYLPLDLTLPSERLGFMLRDAEARAIVFDADVPTPELPAEIARVSVHGREAPFEGEAGIDEGSLAYVLFTSGSTGVPKGVEISHRSLVRRAHGIDFLPLSANTRMLHVAPLGFDISGLEIWGPLLNGGRVVVHEETVPTAAGVGRTVAEHQTNTAVLAVALFNLVVDENPALWAGMRDIFIGGESLSVEHVKRMQRVEPELTIHNGYGPTECTILCTHYPIPADLPADATSIPIGRPASDTHVYVLNRRLQPLPVGVIGELCVGGAGVGRGYLKRPDLTAERFVPDAFGPKDALMYRTGDQVRYRPDGLLEFVGRKDAQVKIRGFRIELSEIEAALGRHPGVASCAVLARADFPGEKRLVAYYVATAQAASAPQLRAHLAALLPPYMVPTRYVCLDELPLTANQKVDRRALPAPDRRRPELTSDYRAPSNPLEARVCNAFGALLDVEGIGRDDNFFELGGSSLLAVRLAEQIRHDAWSDVDAAALAKLAATTVFQNPTPAALATALAGKADVGLDPLRIARTRSTQEPIAIIAMAGRFPGAQDVEAFWDNLCEGRDTITKFRADELDPAVPAADRADPGYVAARGVIDGVELFDAAFFGIGPREAELMDPQQRIFLELCWECLERGGHVPDATTTPVGVFAGMNNATYFQRHACAHPDLVSRVGALQVMLGNEKDYIATRVAHKLNLTGPAISVHNACSTSLVAISQAVESLHSGFCDMALAGGVAVTCPPRSGYLYQEGSMLSPDGHTRTFDAQAKGTVFGDGAAVVLLKRLSDAIADGNRIHAVIRGTAVNNDGGNRASFTAPSSEGQAAVIAMAHDKAGVDPRSISYVEAHGTATPLGDPIEIEGLTKAFRRHTQDTGFCRIGSLKSNVGHLVTAAGAAGVIKTALALEARRIPASIHFQSPNPTIDFASTPFVVNAQLSTWDSDGTPLRAGVSSFGLGGTNVHAVLEQAPQVPASTAAEGPQLLVLSARTPAALGAAVSRLADHLDTHADENLADVAWTLAVGRKAFAHRIAVAADDTAGAIRALREPDTLAEAARSRPARAGDVVFMFPGQGATYPGMGRGLYDTEAVFRDTVDECATLLRETLGFDLRERLFDDDANALLPTSIMQPATFTIEYALARLWISLGVTPSAMIGHSVGEFVAATLAGVFSLEDALNLVARRGALMQAQPAGSMLSIRLPAASVQSRLPEGVSMAAENSPLACVVAGPSEAVAAFQAQLEGEGIACRALRTSHAFHSAMMEPVVAPFRDAVAAVAMQPPTLPVVSTVTGEWLDDATATSADYWARHLREPVRFSPALERVLDDPSRILLEVGPRTTLNALARQQPAVQKQRMATVSSLSDNPSSEARDLRAAAGRLWSQGAALNPAVFDRRAVRHRLRLPTYPFERQRYWVEAVAATASNVIPHPAIVAAAKPQIALETVMPQSVVPNAPAAAAVPSDTGRRERLIGQLRGLFENVAGFDLEGAAADTHFMELGLDSLLLTQVAVQLQKTFPVQITFRQLMADCSSLERLAAAIDEQLPPEAAPQPVAAQPVVQTAAPVAVAPMPVAMPALDGGNDFTRQVIAQQMQLMAQQLALLSGGVVAAPQAAAPQPVAALVPQPQPQPVAATPAPAATPAAKADDEDTGAVQIKYDIKKAFGAIARIDNNAQSELSPVQKAKLDAFFERYIARTRKSKAYTVEHRPHLADPRVVNGFRPLTKEIVYQIVIDRSKGSRVHDIDGNEYVDALNGFGMSLFGWQPQFVLDAVREQLDKGYEIGPQHPVAGEVAKLVCELTGHERAALCNTGSEAVLGAMRVARTVTARSTIVLFTGSYHGIVDEVIVRGTKSLRAVPAAPGILRNTSENVLVLDYGTPESLEIIRSRADEIAAILIEPVQSRRLDFQPVEFLRELRQITKDHGALLIFDEVVTGFRSNPGGVQSIFGIKADLATYGKVVGGGFPIGVIAGKREYMDALDGGHWEYGDDSVPTVGVTYFAGTFVRHPLALVAAKAVLEHFKHEGRAMQDRLNARTSAMVADINAFCEEVGAPVSVKTYASVWKTHFHENHPLQDLLFAMMRVRGIHILDNFPCFLTTAHSDEDIARIATAFKEAVAEMQDLELLPRRAATPRTVMDESKPIVPGARIGREPDGTPAWFVPNPEQPGKYMKVSA